MELEKNIVLLQKSVKKKKEKENTLTHTYAIGESFSFAHESFSFFSFICRSFCVRCILRCPVNISIFSNLNFSPFFPRWFVGPSPTIFPIRFVICDECITWVEPFYMKQVFIVLRICTKLPATKETTTASNRQQQKIQNLKNKMKM